MTVCPCLPAGVVATVGGQSTGTDPDLSTRLSELKVTNSFLAHLDFGGAFFSCQIGGIYCLPLN